MTITLGEAQATGNAVSSSGATVVVQVTPEPQVQGPPPHHNKNGGISQTTEHLLIAAGSIGMEWCALIGDVHAK